MTITTIPWIVVLAFGAFFIFAAVREILHRRRHGPPENPRDVFEFDEDAPSYEEPEIEETQDDDPQDGDTADDRAAPDDTDTDKARQADMTPPDSPDRNETPR